MAGLTELSCLGCFLDQCCRKTVRMARAFDRFDYISNNYALHPAKAVKEILTVWTEEQREALWKEGSIVHRRFTSETGNTPCYLHPDQPTSFSEKYARCVWKKSSISPSSYYSASSSGHDSWKNHSSSSSSSVSDVYAKFYGSTAMFEEKSRVVVDNNNPIIDDYLFPTSKPSTDDYVWPLTNYFGPNRSQSGGDFKSNLGIL